MTTSSRFRRLYPDHDVAQAVEGDETHFQSGILVGFSNDLFGVDRFESLLDAKRAANVGESSAGKQGGGSAADAYQCRL